MLKFYVALPWPVVITEESLRLHSSMPMDLCLEAMLITTVVKCTEGLINKHIISRFGES